MKNSRIHILALLSVLCAAPMVLTAQEHTDNDASPSANQIEQERVGQIEERKVDDGGDNGTGWIKSIIALGVVVGIIFLLRFALRRVAGVRGIIARPTGPVEVLHRVSAGARQQLLLVRFGSQLLLVGLNMGQMRTLGRATDEREVSLIMSQLSTGKPPGADEPKGDSK